MRIPLLERLPNIVDHLTPNKIGGDANAGVYYIYYDTQDKHGSHYNDDNTTTVVTSPKSQSCAAGAATPSTRVHNTVQWCPWRLTIQRPRSAARPAAKA